MPGVTASEVERFFHGTRAGSGRDVGADRVYAGMLKWARRRAEAEALEIAAERDAWERGWG